MEKPNQISNPTALSKILDRFIDDYQRMENYLTSQDVMLQEYKNEVAQLEELLRKVIIEHRTGEIDLPPGLRDNIINQLDK